MKKTALLIWVLVLCLMLSACGEPTPTEMQPTSNQIVTNPDVTPAEPTKGTSVPTEPENTPTEPTEPEDTKPEPGNSCDHEFGQWMVVQEATCEEKGSRLRICALCSYAQVEEMQAKGHTTQSGTCQR